MKTVLWHLGIFLGILAWICLLPLWIVLGIAYLVFIGLFELIVNIVGGWSELVEEARRG